MIDWTDPDYVAQGHFSTIVKSVAITCFKETAATAANVGSLPPGVDAYVFTTNDTKSGVIPRVMLSNVSTNVNGGLGGVVGVGMVKGAVGMALAAVVMAAVGLVI